MTAPVDPTTVIRLLSAERMARYKLAPHEQAPVTDQVALDRYEDQARLQARLWVFIGGVEVIYRNALHQQLTTAYGDWWFQDPTLTSILSHNERKRLDEARWSCERDQRRRAGLPGPTSQIEPGHMVAALTFGFWRKLLSRPYDRTLWTPHLHKAFTPGQRRKDLYEAAGRLNIARNRVAHHEHVTDPDQIKNDGATLTAAIDPTARSWVLSLWH
ncbi:hypothetical protein [Arsenicicoccus dermatophilus]|uniref:hypothetical protein n=1 Tax=Arsenicicoccus dermatophilus TaxID=1076331 RepID=UPI0039173855